MAADRVNILQITICIDKKKKDVLNLSWENISQLEPQKSLKSHLNLTVFPVESCVVWQRCSAFVLQNK